MCKGRQAGRRAGGQAGRQAGRQLDENFCDLKFCDLTNPANFKASFSCLNRFMVLIAR